MGKRSSIGLVAILLIAYAAVFVLSFSIGRFPVGPVELIRILLSRILPIEQDWTRQAESVVLSIRLPRILASSLIGAGLSLSGLIFQMIFRNPLVSPDVLGTSTGAGFGAALALLLALPSAGIAAAAFAISVIVAAEPCPLAMVCVWMSNSYRSRGAEGPSAVWQP